MMANMKSDRWNSGEPGGIWVPSHRRRAARPRCGGGRGGGARLENGSPLSILEARVLLQFRV